jgi:hypothetical protein
MEAQRCPWPGVPPPQNPLVLSQPHVDGVSLHFPGEAEFQNIPQLALGQLAVADMAWDTAVEKPWAHVWLPPLSQMGREMPKAKLAWAGGKS